MNMVKMRTTADKFDRIYTIGYMALREQKRARILKTVLDWVLAIGLGIVIGAGLGFFSLWIEMLIG